MFVNLFLRLVLECIVPRRNSVREFHVIVSSMLPMPLCLSSPQSVNLAPRNYKLSGYYKT